MNARLLALTFTTASLVACAPQGGDPNRQVGPNPYLPEPRQYLFPPMSVAENIFAGRQPLTRFGTVDFARMHSSIPWIDEQMVK